MYGQIQAILIHFCEIYRINQVSKNMYAFFYNRRLSISIFANKHMFGLKNLRERCKLLFYKNRLSFKTVYRNRSSLSQKVSFLIEARKSRVFFDQFNPISISMCLKNSPSSLWKDILGPIYSCCVFMS